MPALDTLIAIADALEVPLREFFPDPGVAEDKSPNRMKLDAEVTAILRGLGGERITGIEASYIDGVITEDGAFKNGRWWVA